MTRLFVACHLVPLLSLSHTHPPHCGRVVLVRRAAETVLINSEYITFYIQGLNNTVRVLGSICCVRRDKRSFGDVMFNISQSWDQTFELNCGPQLEVIILGTPKWDIQENIKTRAHAAARYQTREQLQSIWMCDQWQWKHNCSYYYNVKVPPSQCEDEQTAVDGWRCAAATNSVAVGLGLLARAGHPRFFRAFALLRSRARS